MTEPVFRHEHRVIYAECTVGNHVYYARYLDMLEEARGEFWRRAGGGTCRDFQEAGTIFPVLGVEISYQAPARYDDLLSIELWLTVLAGARLTVGFRILNSEGHTIVFGQTRHVCTSLDEKPKRLPKELIETLRPYLRSAEGVPAA